MSASDPRSDPRHTVGSVMLPSANPPLATVRHDWLAPPNYTDHLERISRALERIVDALERKP